MLSDIIVFNRVGVNMNILEIISRKKNGLSLSYDELEYAFNGYLKKEIPSYQMSALLMAITINGMNMSETLALTDIFIKSGEQYNISEIVKNTVDKHSTGGVGDTTTLLVGPMCAAMGMKMAKMSGKGLGITGGTIDKLESIPGFRVKLSKDELIEKVNEVGFALSSQTNELTPLDKAIYALRDVTGTTESIPLIASSIMSKKIALGAQNILIDIKVGDGALIKTEEDANELSKILSSIGESYNRNVRTIVSNMNTPLSYAIGNALEVKEAINVLHGKRSPLYDTAVEISANLLSMARGLPMDECRMYAEKTIETGKALQKFYEFVKSQDGRLADLNIADNVIPVNANKTGIVVKVDALGCAELAAKLGASKKTLEDKIDYSVGIYLNVKEGDAVKEGDLLMKLYVNNPDIDLDASDFDFIDIVANN